MGRNALPLFFLLAQLLIPSAHARSIEDTLHFKMEVPDHPRRIVALIPSLGELAADLLGDDLNRLVGVSEYTDYPPALKKVRSIGRYDHFNLEQVASLKPDLCLATLDGNSKDQVEHLRELKIPVLVVGGEDFSQIEESIRLVATALGVEERGKEMAAQFKRGLAHIQEKAKDRPLKRKVLIQLGEDPLVTVGLGSFLNEAVNAVGAINIYGQLHQHYPRPSIEDVVHRNPDVIVILPLTEDTQPFRQMALNWFQFSSLEAVKKKHVRIVPGNAIVRPTLRLLEGLSLLEKAIYD